MFTKIAQFEGAWKHEAESTLKLLDVLTDASLKQAVTPDDRTLGRIAWHITTSISEMMERAGIKVGGPAPDSLPPASGAEIRSAYAGVSSALVDRIKSDWKDETLQVKDDMYGESWERGFTLMVLITHQIHHRGQMTVLMRQAGLRVPGIYGPAREEWVAYGMPAPAV